MLNLIIHLFKKILLTGPKPLNDSLGGTINLVFYLILQIVIM